MTVTPNQEYDWVVKSELGNNKMTKITELKIRLPHRLRQFVETTAEQNYLSMNAAVIALLRDAETAAEEKAERKDRKREKTAA